MLQGLRNRVIVALEDFLMKLVTKSNLFKEKKALYKCVQTPLKLSSSLRICFQTFRITNALTANLKQ